MTPKFFSKAPSGSDHIEMTAQSHLKFPSSSMTDIPMDFHLFFSNFCPKAFLLRHRFVLVSMQGWWEYQVDRWHPMEFFYNMRIFQGQLEVMQESQVTGPCIEHAQVHNSLQHGTTIRDHDKWACNSPNTWEHDMAQPIAWAWLWCSLCDCNCNKKTVRNKTETLVIQSVMQTKSLGVQT